MFRTLLIAILLVLGAAEAHAVTPRPGTTDPRIHFVDYDPFQVVELKGALRRQLTVEFDPSERIENVAIGDSLGWQVTPNRRANLLFLKPMAQRPATNMTVVTNMTMKSIYGHDDEHQDDDKHDVGDYDADHADDDND